MIVAIFAVTIVAVVKHLSSTPARIAAVLASVAVLFAVVPRIIEPLAPSPATPAPEATTTVDPAGPPPAPFTAPGSSETPSAGGAL
ncbi:hypothetical protein OG880_33330 (plasmid) [Streptomyces cellulosae]|nr:hypothetical protein OG880_33330 [Streptomyces cellulosae]